MRIVAITLMVILGVRAAHATCGERGGPGYRGPDGQCVSKANIARICGSPPTTHCTAEQMPSPQPGGSSAGTDTK